MKKYFICLFLVFSFFYLNAKEIIIKIIDNDLDIPLEGVRLVVKDTGKSYYSSSDGIVKINISDDQTKLLITASLIGYETKKIVIKDFDKNILIKLSIGGILEGKELVIEEEAVSKKDEEIGVSKVINKDEFKSTAMMGPIEDVMSTIKVLPGVSYAGKFNSKLSVRGGDPEELTALLDGFIVRYPYHWGRAFSIFNPNIIESVKFSTGIFSCRNGLSTSGLMEVSTVKPTEGLRMTALLSASTVELFIQTPLGNNKKAGLFVGGRITFYDLIVAMTGWLMDQRGLTLSRNPYIYDAYLKWYFKPLERFEWYVNGFFGSDGIGVKTLEVDKDPDKEIVSKFDLKQQNWDTFVATGFKILPADRLFIHILAGYEFLLYDVDLIRSSEGAKKYSDDFKNEYGFLVGGDKGFSIDIDSKYKRRIIMHSIQARSDFDLTLHDKIMMSIGAGAIYDFNIYNEEGDFWRIIFDGSIPQYVNNEYDIDTPDNNILKSFLYLNFIFNIIPEILKIETGCRVDHNLILGKDNFYLNTLPVPGPRFNIIYTPLKNLGWLDHLSVSTGAGLFSKVPPETVELNKDYNINPDFGLSIPMTLAAVMGLEMEFGLGFKFKIEGYYKFIFNKFYINEKKEYYEYNKYESEYLTHSDGYGHIAGFDISIERKLSRYIDGIISYSFVFVRMINPQTDDTDNETTVNGEPAGRWFYPSYHRFHNLNFVLNIKPVSFMTITAKISFVSGVPEKIFDDKKMFAARIYNDVYAEMYTRDSSYDDNTRTVFKFMFDLRLSFNYYFRKTKIRVESYIGCEDIFAPLFYYIFNNQGLNTGAVDTDLFTGEDTPKPEGNFDLGIPIPSFGLKLSF